ncbi:hypothetical protein F5Y16DRAFT_40202 [Xylariaceae sp. FL0255]|nr:hypothetical protein F5Y16DRAFT_40202 [Xylariaceae sp. FL0255]
MTTKFAFVSVSGKDGKVESQNSGLVRSHCMRGKNTRDNSRRSLRAARRQKLGPTSDSGVAVTSAPHGDHVQHVHPEPRSTPVMSLDWEIIRFINKDTPGYPRELASIASLFIAVKDSSYPIYQCFHFSDKVMIPVIQFLTEDAVFQQAVRLMVLVYKDQMRQQPSSTNTLKHHQSLLLLLNDRLSNDVDTYATDSTFWTINCLANISFRLGRHDEVIAHSSAIKTILQLRGRDDFLSRRPTLRYHMYCLDLATYSSSGRSPELNNHTSKHVWEQISDQGVLNPKPELACDTSIGGVNALIDPRVLSLLSTLKRVTTQVNSYMPSSHYLDSSWLQTIYDSIFYDLLYLRDSLQDTASEALCFGIQAFLITTALRPPGISKLENESDISLYPDLTRKLRNSCGAFEAGTAEQCRLLFWLLTMEAMLIFNPEKDDWLKLRWTEIAGNLLGESHCWEDAKAQLERVLWIRQAHDDLGLEVYTKLRSSSPSCPGKYQA